MQTISQPLSLMNKSVSDGNLSSSEQTEATAHPET